MKYTIKIPDYKAPFDRELALKLSEEGRYEEEIKLITPPLKSIEIETISLKDLLSYIERLPKEILEKPLFKIDGESGTIYGFNKVEESLVIESDFIII